MGLVAVGASCGALAALGEPFVGGGGRARRRTDLARVRFRRGSVGSFSEPSGRGAPGEAPAAGPELLSPGGGFTGTQLIA